MYDSTYISALLDAFRKYRRVSCRHIHIGREAYVCIHTWFRNNEVGAMESVLGYTCVVKNPRGNSTAEVGRQCRAVIYRTSKVTRRSWRFVSFIRRIPPQWRVEEGTRREKFQFEAEFSPQIEPLSYVVTLKSNSSAIENEHARLKYYWRTELN